MLRPSASQTRHHVRGGSGSGIYGVLGGVRTMIKRILLPLERGDDDGAAVRFARILSERRDVEILLLRIEEWPILGSLGGGWVPAWRSADLGLVQAGFGGRKPRILAPEAVPSATITEQAALHAASLVLFTYRREPAWIRMMYGN